MSEKLSKTPGNERELRVWVLCARYNIGPSKLGEKCINKSMGFGIRQIWVEFLPKPFTNGVTFTWSWVASIGVIGTIVRIKWDNVFKELETW